MTQYLLAFVQDRDNVIMRWARETIDSDLIAQNSADQQCVRQDHGRDLVLPQQSPFGADQLPTQAASGCNPSPRCEPPNPRGEGAP